MWEEFINLMMNFFLNVIKLTKENLKVAWMYNSTQNSTPPFPRPELEAENSVQNTTSVVRQSRGTNDVDSHMMWMQWSLIGVCVAVIATTVQALQTTGPFHSMISFHWISMALVFSSTAVLVSIYIPVDYKLTSLLVVHVAIFIAFTALVVALVINLHPPFKVTSIAVYSIGILIIIFANLCKSKT